MALGLVAIVFSGLGLHHALGFISPTLNHLSVGIYKGILGCAIVSLFLGYVFFPKEQQKRRILEEFPERVSRVKFADMTTRVTEELYESPDGKGFTRIFQETPWPITLVDGSSAQDGNRSMSSDQKESYWNRAIADKDD